MYGSATLNKGVHRLTHSQSDGAWELRLPTEFTPKTPDLAFFQHTYTTDLASHPSGKRYPAATRGASTQPLDPSIKALLVPHTFPASFDEMVKRQWPQLTLFASSFNDATILSVLFSHTAMDASAIMSLLRNWSLVMAGKEDQVESVQGTSVDPLQALDLAMKSTEPHIRDPQCMKWWQIIAFVALFLWRKMTWPSAESRMIYLPEDVLHALKSRTIPEARASAAGSEAFISEGDILTAWLSRTTLAGTQRQLPATILDVINVRNRISDLDNRGIFLQNMLCLAFTPLSTDEMQSSIGNIALLHRRAITHQLSETEMTKHLQRMRRAIRNAPFSLPPVLYGHSSAFLLASNNVSKPGYVAMVDFSPAMRGVRKPSTGRKNPPGTPVFGITMPADMSHMTGFNSIWGKDNQGGFWLSATMYRAGWDVLEEDIAVLMGEKCSH